VSLERERQHLHDILESIELIGARTRVGKATFLSDVDVQDAVLWRLQTLAEATSKLTSDRRDRHPEIPWRAIYGFRNVAAHENLKLSLPEAWDIIETQRSILKLVVEEELKRDEI
jgi:uncharacterized protein with HEPN domain